MSTTRTQAGRFISFALTLAASLGIGLWLFVHWTLYYVGFCDALLFLPLVVYRGSLFTKVSVATLVVGFLAGGLFGLKLSS